MSSWTVLNQIVKMEKLENPIDGAVDLKAIATFADTLFLNLTNIENSLLVLGVDESSDTIKQISKYRNGLDNGADCTQLNTPQFRLIELFAAKTQKAAVIDDKGYATHNLFSLTELAALGEDTTFDGSSDITVDVSPGIKMIFKKNDTEYIPYWADATNDVFDAMDSLAVFDTTNIKAEDGKVELSEVICAPEKLK